METLEKMSDFFAARADMYDEHMLNEVEGCREAYCRLAELLPEKTERLLDLGCGTGLELEWIFRRFPDIEVTGIDLTKEMLDRLCQKYPERRLELIHGSYFDCNLGKKRYDCAVSVQTMHHFEYAQKEGLYRRVRESLKPGGCYLECDYMVLTQEEEDRCFEESRRLRRELRLPEDEFYHLDTPCTVHNQIQLLLKSGFSRAQMMYREGNTTIVAACR